MSVICTAYPSDYLKVKESELNLATKKFRQNSDRLLNQIKTAHNCLDETFSEISECKGENREEKCCGEINCKGREEVYSDALQELADFAEYKKYLDDQLLFIEESNRIDEPDRELLGLPPNEQNCVLHKRIASLENEKKWTRKILNALFEEFDIVREKEVEPSADAEVMRHLVHSRKSQVKTLEDQLNAEVHRIEKAFAEKYKKMSKSKQKYDQNDWELRTEIQPKIFRLHNALFKANEDLKKVNDEIFDLERTINERESENEKLEDESKSLERELEHWTRDFKSASREVKLLRNELEQTVVDIESAKASFSKEFTEFCENTAIDARIKEIFKDDLETQVDCSRELTLKTFAAIACVTNQLENKICCMKSLLEGSCYRREKLQTHADFLRGIKTGETLGNDYHGSKFVTFVETFENCGN